MKAFAVAAVIVLLAIIASTVVGEAEHRKDKERRDREAANALAEWRIKKEADDFDHAKRAFAKVQAEHPETYGRPETPRAPAPAGELEPVYVRVGTPRATPRPAPTAAEMQAEILRKYGGK